MNATFSNEGKQNLEIGLDVLNMPTEDKASRLVIALDFGTTFSSVSWAWNAGSHHDLCDERAIHTIPTSWGEEIKTTSMILRDKLALVDTPGFDDTNLSAKEIVQSIAKHLEEL